MPSNDEPTKKSAPKYSGKQRSSQDRLTYLLSDLRECTEKGLIKLAEGNRVLPLKKPN